MILGMPMDMTKIPSYLTISAAAERLDVDPATVGRWLRDGKLRAHIPVQAAGERLLVLLWEPDVTRFAEARKVVAGRV
jgi:excisionase family DNA binding protein